MGRNTDTHLEVKTIIAVVLFIIMAIVHANAQTGIRLSGSLDGRLLVLGDDRGNDPGTIDGTFKIHFEEFENRLGFWTVGLKYQNAGLSSGRLQRYGIEAGHAFNVGPLRATPLFGYGVLIRDRSSFQSFEFAADIEYILTDHWSLLMAATLTQRSEYGIWRENVGFGIKYLIKSYSRE